VIPLEIWDLVSSHGPLFELSEHPCFVGALLETLEALHHSTAQPPAAHTGLAVARGFAGLVIGGGGLLRPGVVNALRAHHAAGHSPWSRLMLEPDPVFMAETGGHALAQGQGICPLIIDVGQTALKLMCAERRALVQRDWQTLPTAASVASDQQTIQRQNLRRFVAEAARSFVQHGSARPDVVVLALPCELDDQGMPGHCTYAGLERDGAFADTMLAAAGLAELPCLLVNDAELAAVSARARWANQLPPRTLVLTLGLGVGAALLEKEGADEH
jgi:hypothetical protein